MEEMEEIDKTQFYQVFFEEVAEHLSEMERLLLNLNVNSPNSEDLNAIFRAVHSIKGASGTFGFQGLTEVAHILESVFDKVRNGTLGLKNEMIDLFLEAGDVLKAQSAAYKNGIQVDPSGDSDLYEKLKQLADGAQGEKEDLDETSYIEKRSQETGGRRAPDNLDAEGLQAGRRTTDKFTSSIRVSIKKVDQLINQVGELVITQAMLAQTSQGIDLSAYEKLQNGLAELDRNTRDLQESVMNIRMTPIGVAFSRFPRMVRDMARKLNKLVEIKTIGEETELDKGLIERLVDPLTHLIRNSLDHGIENTDQRMKAGKNAKGVITLRALHQGGNIVIEVSDDGAGLNRGKIIAKAIERGLDVKESITDQEVWQLIFAPGFSTAEIVTDVSGRGVGMDVVKRGVHGMGGTVEIRSEQGRGSKFTIRLPLTLAIIEGMMVRVGCEVYIIPLFSIIESIRPTILELKTVLGKGEVVEVRGDYLRIARLHNLFGVTPDQTDPTKAVLIITEAGGERVAILVDDIFGQQQVVIKSLEQNFHKTEGISGATILGNGRVAFILDVRGLLGLVSEEKTILYS